MKIGIDFGTTNSAVAVLDEAGTARILELAPGEAVQRSVIHADPDGNVRFGNEAMRAYQASDLQGRFLRSLKAFLSHDVPKTTLGRQRLSYTEVVGAYVSFLVRETERVTGEKVTGAVVGRPVRFHDDPKRNDLAEGRLLEALEIAGIRDPHMQMEPVAAARRYEAGLSQDRTVLIGDFGGGTADFAVLKVGPSRRVREDRAEDVLAVTGVAKAGDALDGRFMDAFLMPWFGRGAVFRRPYTDEPEDWDHHLFHQILELYYLHQLRDSELERSLKQIQRRMDDPQVVRRLLHLVFDDLGYPMAWAIEGTKRALSSEEHALFRFEEFPFASLAIEQPVSRGAFAEASSGILAAYREAVSEALDTAGVRADEVDEAFLTGGTSQLPFVRQLFVDLLGPGKVSEANAFTSVCEGLALS
ncbi:MAG: Hsp70 family protein [Deltaproteobacteria bacterium]|nr:MAG: Hsp70 family protein [Deltaproteobacteria bacterium]